MNKKALLPLIGLFLLVTGIVLPGSAYAQISEGGTPTSFKYQNTLKSAVSYTHLDVYKRQRLFQIHFHRLDLYFGKDHDILVQIHPQRLL